VIRPDLILISSDQSCPQCKRPAGPHNEIKSANETLHYCFPCQRAFRVSAPKSHEDEPKS